tara:strand:- start:266 stop:421 length:156 start_codon:yes stop_codon:yes gene_type:complete
MAIYMGAMMAVIMLLFMLPMYESKIKNVSILIGSVVIFLFGAIFGAIASYH